jgi:hypothetical protein
MSKDKNNHEIDLSKYEDPGGLSIKGMNFGLWLSENRKKIEKIIIIFLIALSAFFFIYSSYNYIIYFLHSSAEESDTANLVNSNITSQRDVASDMVIKTPQIFKSGGTYDLAVDVTNPNNKFSGNFQYCFIVNKADTGCGNGYILPGEEKYIFSLGQKLDTDSPTVSFEIRSISWKRIDSHTITDWNSFANGHLNFSLKDIKFTPAGSGTSGGTNSLSSLEFSITNLTDYGYYSVPLNIAFYNGSELVGANIFVVNNFLAGEERAVRLNWVSGISEASRIEIRPNLNILDDSIYLKYQGVQ